MSFQPLRLRMQLLMDNESTPHFGNRSRSLAGRERTGDHRSARADELQAEAGFSQQGQRGIGNGVGAVDTRGLVSLQQIGAKYDLQARLLGIGEQCGTQRLWWNRKEVQFAARSFHSRKIDDRHRRWRHDTPRQTQHRRCQAPPPAAPISAGHRPAAIPSRDRYRRVRERRHSATPPATRRCPVRRLCR